MPNYKALNALAEIRDYMRETSRIPDAIVEDFNQVATSLGGSPEWCGKVAELTPEQQKESDRLLEAMKADSLLRPLANTLAKVKQSIHGNKNP